MDPTQLDLTNPDVLSEIAAMWVAAMEGIPIEQARQLIQTPQYASIKQLAMQLASTGALNSLFESQQPTAAAAGADPTAASVGESVAGEAAAEATRKQQKHDADMAAATVALDQARQDLANAKTAEERAAAQFRIQQATFALQQAQFQESMRQNQRQTYSGIAQNLISAASQARGPRDYHQFQQATSGGRSLQDLLFGSTPRPAFSAPAGKLEPKSVQSMLEDLGLVGSGGMVEQVAKDLGYVG